MLIYPIWQLANTPIFFKIRDKYYLLWNHWLNSLCTILLAYLINFLDAGEMCSSDFIPIPKLLEEYGLSGRVIT